MVRAVVSVILVLSILRCGDAGAEEVYLSISPSVNQTDENNVAVIATVEAFLRTKNSSLTYNPYWIPEDFAAYAYPYADIYHIENSRHGENYYRPSLLELVTLGTDRRLIKLAFIGVNAKNGERILRCLYTMVAVKTEAGWLLSRATDHYTRNWQTSEQGSVTYLLPPGKEANAEEVEAQLRDIQTLCAFFGVEPVPITYYSCMDPRQLYAVKGFDYLADMYVSETGGLAEPGNIIYSANNAEYYTHEVVHLYVSEIFGSRNRLLDEGLATYFGGSGGFTYAWHKDNLREYLETSDPDFADYLDPYADHYIAGETPLPYLVGALICERTLRVHGKDKLLRALASDADLWAILKDVGLTRDNLTEELRKVLR